MPFVKLVKNSAFFSRYQVQYRRRREGKTDYYARKRLIIQDKDKYNSPKFRLVVRFTNTDVICQIVYSKINGDVIMTVAYAHELARYGVPVGHTNYASAYATGLLLARRHLSKLGLATKYIGKEKADGAEFKVTPIEDGPRPFLAFLDVGLARTTTGAKVFAALKGAVDGGLNVPHCEKRFYGYDKSKKASNPAKLRKAILGGVVADYMLHLSKSNPSKFKKQFSRYIKNGVTADKIEAMYIKAHAQIRENPAHVPKPKKEQKEGATKKNYRKAKLTRQQKNDAIAKKLALRNRLNKKKAQKN